MTTTAAHESEIVRPVRGDVVDFDSLRQETKACDPTEEPERCAMLGAVFDFGAVNPQDFPASVRNVYGN